MIIKELYVDHFLENDDLTLADLSEQLNVIRAPSQVEVEFLHAFIPAMLYGEGDSAGNEPPVSGSALIQIGSGDFELLRIAAGGMAGLHVLDEHGEVTECPLQEWLKRLSAPTYLSVFTDCFAISDRLDQWRASGLIDLFADPDPLPPAQRKVDESLLTAEARKLQRQVERLIQQRYELLVELVSGPDVREEYLKARALIREAEQRVEQVGLKLDRSQQRIQPIELAIQWVEPWEQQSELTAQIEDLRALRVRPKDLKRLQRVEQQLSATRATLRKLRKQVDDEPSAVEPPHTHDAPQAHPLFAQRQEALHRLHRSEQLQQELLNISGAEQRDRESVVDAVKQVKDTAQCLREARRRFHAATNEARQRAQDESRGGSSAAAVNEDDLPSVEEIREQIKQLKAETHRLLKRRLLPPLIVLMLGAVFAIGVACLMAALVLDLRSVDTSVGAIGVTAMLASALLKLSFERPPDRQLRAHRERIQQLLSEAAQRDFAPQPDSAADDSIPIPLNETVGPRVVVPGPGDVAEDPPQVSPRIRQELEAAYQDWVSLLGQYDLDPEVKPRDAVVEVRRRHAEQSNLRPDERSTLHLEQEEHRRWLDRYRKSLVAFLASPPRVAHPALEDASWEELLARLEAEGNADVEKDPTPTTDAPSPRRIGDVQRQIKQLKRSRDKILRRTGAKNADDLRSRVERKQQLADLESDLDRVQRRISRELAKVDFGADVQKLLDRKSKADLKKQLDRKQADVKGLKPQWNEAHADLENARDAVEKLLTDNAQMDLRLQLNLVNAQLVEASEHWRVAQIGRRAVGQVQPSAPFKNQSSAALQEATRLLQTSRDLPCQLLYDGDRQQFQYVDPSQNVIPIRELGRSEAELIVMCLQVALVKHLAERVGIRLPLVLDDHSLGYPAEHAMQFGRLLCSAASEGTQLFLFSCHEAVTDLFNQLGVPTLVVQRTVSADENEPPRHFPDEVEAIDDIVDADAARDASDADEMIDTEVTDWIPVEYHVADTSDARDAPPSDNAVDRDGIGATARSASDATVSKNLLAKLDQLRRSSSNTAKRYRIDRPHTDLPARPPTPRRSKISAGDDEFPDWWPD